MSSRQAARPHRVHRELAGGRPRRSRRQRGRGRPRHRPRAHGRTRRPRQGDRQGRPHGAGDAHPARRHIGADAQARHPRHSGVASKAPVTEGAQTVVVDRAGRHRQAARRARRAAYPCLQLRNRRLLEELARGLSRSAPKVRNLRSSRSKSTRRGNRRCIADAPHRGGHSKEDADALRGYALCVPRERAAGARGRANTTTPTSSVLQAVEGETTPSGEVVGRRRLPKRGMPEDHADLGATSKCRCWSAGSTGSTSMAQGKILLKDVSDIPLQKK